MVDSAEFKKNIELLLSQDYNVEFLGGNFDQIVLSLSDVKAEKMYIWIRSVIEREVQPILVGSTKPYKGWKVNELLTFRYPFSIENTEYRILFVKVKNSIYVEFHLGDHKYYDKVRKDLNLKEDDSCADYD